MARQAWLSITPEPERELPFAIAALRAGRRPDATEIEAERMRAERLVTGGRRRAWLAYLREARALAEQSPDHGSLGESRALVLDVLDNHDQLKLGLPRRHGGPR